MDVSVRMVLLALISCLDFQERNMATLQDALKMILEKIGKDLGFSDIPWGPIAHKGPGLVSDSLAFIIQDELGLGIPEYTLVIRGTNPVSIQSWLFQDLDVSGLTPWSRQSPHTGATGACISKATDKSLGIHKGLRDGDASILEWIKRTVQANEAAGIKLNVAGHSLGGLMSATFAAWIHDELSHEGLSGKVDLHIYSYAGPSAGNGEFASYMEGLFGQKLRRFVNPLDVATHVWAEGEMKDALPGLYAPAIWMNDFEKQEYERLVERIEGMGYRQPGQGVELGSEVFDHILFKDYVMQAAYQHVVPYIEWAFKSAPMSVSKVVLDILSDDMKGFKIPAITGRYSWFKTREIKAIMARKA